MTNSRITLNHTIHLLAVLNYAVNCTNNTSPEDPCNSVIARHVVRFKCSFAPLHFCSAYKHTHAHTHTSSLFHVCAQVPRFVRLPLTGPAFSPAPEVQVGGNLGITRSVHTYGYRNYSGTFQIDVFSEFWSIKEVLLQTRTLEFHSDT